jgi:hypothetical protein
VWAVGDGADGSARARALAARMARSRPARVLYLGDVYDTGTAGEFTRNFAGVYGGLAKRMLPTPGNHDWANRAQGYDPFWARTLGAPLPDHYARSVGGWQVLSLNSEGDVAAQAAWLRSRLTGAGTCRIAFWHRPRFSDGLHGDQTDIEPLWAAVRGRAALVLNGHDHDMQRFKPIAGTTELVSGAGGRERYPVLAGRRLAFSDSFHFGALRIVLRRRRADLAFVATDGTVLDRSSVGCRPL